MLEEIGKQLKRIGFLLFHPTKKVVIPIVAAVAAVVIIAGSTYVVMKWMGKNVAEAAVKYTSSVNIDKNGNISTDESAEDLWNEMLDKGFEVDKYFDGPDDLARLMKAEIVTQLPDTREDVTKEIDWDKLQNNADTLQGIIKFKRHDSNGNEYYMTYANPTEFQNQVEIFNKTASESSRQYLETHYTLQEGASGSSASPVNGIGSFPTYQLSDSQLNILARICAREQGSAKGAAAEASLMANLFELAGSKYGTGADGLYNYVVNSGWFGSPGTHDIPSSVSADVKNAVQAVLVQGYRTLPKYVNEHDCFEDLAAVNGKETGLRGIKSFQARASSCPSWVKDRSIYKQNSSKIENVYGSKYTFYCFPEEGADPFGYTSEKNRQKYGDFCYEYGTWQPLNGTEDKTKTDVEADKTSSSKNSDGKSDSKDEDSDSSTPSNFTGQLDKSASGDGYPEGSYTSSAGITYKAYRQDTGSWAGASYWDGTIASSGCGPTSVAILASGIKDPNITPLQTAKDMGGNTGADTLKAEMQKLGMSSDIIYNESASDITNALKNGKVMLVSVTAETKFTNNSHIMAVVDINSAGQVFVLNPNSQGSTSSPSGWYNPKDLLVNGTGHYIVTTYAGQGVANVSTQKKTSPGYQAVVATFTATSAATGGSRDGWESELDDIGVTNENETTYVASTTTVDYESMVQPYVLQFDLLWSLFVIGQDKNFIFALSDLAYHSDIEVSVYDTEITTTDTDVYTYGMSKEAKVTGKVAYEMSDTNGRRTFTRDVKHDHLIKKNADGTKDYSELLNQETGKVVKTVTTTVGTVNAALTKANTWIADYETSYEQSDDGGNTSTQEIALNKDKKYSDWQDDVVSADNCGLIDKAKEEVAKEVNDRLENMAKAVEEENTYIGDNSTVQTLNANDQTDPASIRARKITANDVDTSKVNVKTRRVRVGVKDNATTTIRTKSYTNLTPNLVIKDDETTAPNFVTLFNQYEYRNNKHNILSATDWLFEIMKENENIADQVDLIKYLLYKATGVSYGVTEIDPSIFMPGTSNNISNDDFVGDSTEEKVWWALRNAGYSKEATAGVMGNIWRESHFDPKAVEGNGEGHGLCQWSFGRKTKLFAYAKSKGVDWTDLNTQIEFLLTELTGSGKAKGYATYQLMANHGYTVSDWKNAKTVEDATTAFCWIFERPGVAAMDERISYANKYYNEFKDKQQPSGADSSSTTSSSSRNAIVQRARAEIGKPYHWGAVGPSSYDCSGLVSYALTGKHSRIGTTDTFMGWEQISKSQAQPGDVVTNDHHCGVYIGGEKMIHAPHSGATVTISPVHSDMRYVRPPAKYLK